MSFTVTDAMVAAYSGNVRMLAQQEKARMRGKSIQDNIVGEDAFLEQVAPTAARKVLARHSDSPVMNTQHLRRRVAPYDYDWGDLVDKLDQQRLLIDPASVYAVNAAAALNRSWDDEFINACWATAYTGHAGGTSVTWPNGNSESSPTAPAGTQIAVNDWTYGNGSGNAGLTISKLVYAMVQLDKAEGEEEEERYVAIGAKQKGNLLATTEATLDSFGISDAKSGIAALRDGKIGKICGFMPVHTERLQTNSSTYTRVPAWRKTGMGMGISKEISGQIAERPDKRFSLYVYASMSVGGARLEEAKLVEIICQ